MWPADGLGAGSFYSLLKKESSNADAGYYPFDVSSVRHWVVHAGTDAGNLKP